ncbi:MAG TPA: hypothetical protein VKA46_14040 [Gemmataceae bacterium]|nr:hypothetical protein [Gemmataceae bacterium]
MIELTPEQRQAIEQGQPVRVIDRTTLDTYVLLRAEAFEELTGQRPIPADDASAEIPPGILRSMQGFWRDLPELLKSKRNHRKWVAYHGEERVGIAADDRTLIRELNRRKIPPDAWYVATIRPRQLAPWEIEEVADLKPEHLQDY